MRIGGHGAAAAARRSHLARSVVGVGLCMISAALAWRIGMLLFTEHYNSHGWQIDVGPAPWWVFIFSGVVICLLGGLLLFRGADHAQAAVVTPAWRLTGGFALICAVTGLAAAYDNTAPDNSGAVGPDLTFVVWFGLPILVGIGCYRLLGRPTDKPEGTRVQRWRGAVAWASGVLALALSFLMTNVR